jgi:HSP20 family molecular chaperone IbpA
MQMRQTRALLFREFGHVLPTLNLRKKLGFGRKGAMNKPATEAKVYSSANRLTVVAPMPGLDADRIQVSLAGELLTIETAERSAHRSEVRVALPRSVNGATAMAVYAYGVLVVSLPLAKPDDPGLNPLGPELVKRRRPAAARQI